MVTQWQNTGNRTLLKKKKKFLRKSYERTVGQWKSLQCSMYQSHSMAVFSGDFYNPYKNYLLTLIYTIAQRKIHNYLWRLTSFIRASANSLSFKASYLSCRAWMTSSSLVPSAGSGERTTRATLSAMLVFMSSRTFCSSLRTASSV